MKVLGGSRLYWASFYNAPLATSTKRVVMSRKPLVASTKTHLGLPKGKAGPWKRP